MPIPAAPTDQRVSDAVVALFRQVHEQLRVELEDMDETALNWVPVPGANSIATVITHLLGSEAETLRVAAGLSGDRERDAEFSRRRASRGEVQNLLQEADGLLTQATPDMEARLWEPVTLPTLPAEEIRPVITWLIGNYGHAREHLGHIQLTRQLHRSSVG